MIVTWSSHPTDEWMPEQLLVETLHKVRSHPWWLARARLALALLRQHGILPPASVLEAGCGWGVNLQALEEAGYHAVGLDISRKILELLDAPQRNLVVADLSQDFVAPGKLFDAILALDVIEHLDDDRGALNRLARLLRPGGLLVVSVPALPQLFSEFDRVQGHRRRYLPETLHAAFGGAGLEVKKQLWWGAWMVPVLSRTRNSKPNARKKSYSDYLRLPPWPGPLLMKLLFALEKNRALRGALRTGTSLFALATRPMASNP